MLRFSASILLLLFSAIAYPLTSKDALLLKKEEQQYQAWVLARNYLFGTTLKPDRIRALAWQLIYVGQLPSSYPQKENLLTFYQQGLTTEQISRAYDLSQFYRQRYGLHEPFNEEEMYRVYALHENMVSPKKQTGVVGRVLPWAGLDKANMLLCMETNTSQILEPWYQSAIPLTITNNGEFYVTSLKPGRYTLFINTAGLSTSKQFNVQEGEVRGLSLIDLRSRVYKKS